MKNNVVNIAIDGPSGAGKSTIARLLAKRLNMVYLDTGAMYRAIALAAHAAGLQPIESQALEQLLAGIRLDITYHDGVQKIGLNGRDVSAAIREHAVSKLASDFSALQSVRIKLVELQRELAGRADTVLDGRDIGSFVLPDAKFKFYLDASAEVRADRRCRELRSRGEACDRETVYKDIVERDYNDMHRQFSPLVKAPGAVVVDSSDMTIEQVVTRMLEVINA